MAIGVLPIFLVACARDEPNRVAVNPPLQIETFPGCTVQGRTAELELEVCPGLVLMRITGLPSHASNLPEWDVFMHWMRTTSLSTTPDVEIFIVAKCVLGAEVVGHRRFSGLCPSPRFWKMGVCIPVPCRIALPISSSSVKWELELRIRTAIGKASSFPLGTIRLG